MITQADREAAADYEEHFPPYMGGQVFRDGVADDHPLVQAFARHREQAEAAIVAWLENQECPVCDCSDAFLRAVARIEAGDHLTAGGGGG